ncbi:hypothetical protein [Lacisediminihabitans changchengi]|uniref:Uncharacterized protein n=1 Tax=Lacisediminihabitans changchengi TaxID=2787634 RepID=A0A934SQM7_9MICO|nr:hypothetical protein [Lacisediminihabitans changchengi]MBK4347210.1 hypothetical protein [Lacisediminihabitans changchengi]
MSREIRDKRSEPGPPPEERESPGTGFLVVEILWTLLVGVAKVIARLIGALMA